MADERSPLWSWTAGGAMASGLGYGLYSNRSSFKDILTKGWQDPTGQAADMARKAGGFNLGRISTPVSAVEESKLMNLSKFDMVTDVMHQHRTDIKQLTYQSMMSSGRVSHKDAVAAMGFVGKQKSTIDAYKAAADEIQRSGGNLDVLNRGLEDLGTPRRQRFLKNAVVSSGTVTKKGRFVKLDELNPKAAGRFRDISSRLKSAFGPNQIPIDWEFMSVVDRYPSGRGTLTTAMAIGQFAGARVNIPLENTGFTYGGSNLTSRYATRRAYTPQGKLINYSNFYADKIIEAVQKSSDKTSMKANVQEAARMLTEQFGSRESASAGSAAIWTSPIMTAGGRAKARLVSQEAVPVGDMSQDNILRMLGQRLEPAKGKSVPGRGVFRSPDINIGQFIDELGAGFYPYTSAGPAGKGVLSTKDIATAIYGDLGPLMSAEKIPTQFVRKEWESSAAAKQIAQGKSFTGAFGKQYSRFERKLQGPLYKRLLYGGGEAMSKAASDPSVYTAPQLMTFYAKPSTSGYGLGYQADALNKMLSAEEGVISSSVSGMMEHERIVQKKIVLDKGMRINEEILDQARGRSASARPIMFDSPIGGGDFIGIERGTGKEISLQQGADLRQQAIGMQITGPDEATVLLRERHRISEKDMWKFFSEENKFMAATADEKKMREVLKAAGLGDIRGVGGQRIEAVFSGKLVGKNKMSQINQQIEAASIFLADKLKDPKSPHRQTINSFLADPAKMLNINGIMSSGAVDADVRIQRNLLGFTRKMGFSEFETKLTYGMMDLDIASRLEGETGYRGFARLVEKSPGVVGLGKFRPGDLAAGGTGGRGSIEGTGLRLMTMKGKEEMKFAAELTKRMTGKGELLAADRMLASVIGEQDLTTKIKQFGKELTPFQSASFASPEGRYLSLGRKFQAFGGSSNIYIPGTEEAHKLMSPVLSSRGEFKHSPLVQELNSFRKLMTVEGAAEEELERAAVSLRNTIASAAEEQAYGRGKIVGSSVLTGVRHSFKEQSDTFRVSAKTAQDMFEDLTKRADTEDQIRFLEEQRRALFEGKTLSGGMWRHPTTGPESFQFVKYKLDKRVADGMVAAPTKFGTLQFQGGAPIDVDVSEMVGFKGDFDRDQYVLAAMSDRDTAGRVTKKIDHQMRDNYNRYLFNHYTMKNAMDGTMSKSDVLDMTSKEALRSGYKKLSTAKTATGQVNIALQKLKLGIQHTAPEKYRPMAELFWHLEEAAIGGKHGVLSSELYQGIASSVRTGGETGTRQMEQIISTLMGADERTITGSITDAAGNITEHQLKYSPRKWAEIAISSYDAASNDVNVAMRAAAMATGKNAGDVDLNKLVEQYYTRRAGSLDSAQAMMQAAYGETDEFTMKASRLFKKTASKAQSFGRVMSRAKGPLMLGALAAGGIMMAAPSVSGSIPPSKEGVGGGRNMEYNDYGPAGGLQMNPPPPGPNIAPKVYDIGGGKQTSRANIRMRINDLNTSSRDFMRSARELSAGGNVNIRTKDDRDILDARSLASKIHERL